MVPTLNFAIFTAEVQVFPVGSVQGRQGETNENDAGTEKRRNNDTGVDGNGHIQQRTSAET